MKPQIVEIKCKDSLGVNRGIVATLYVDGVKKARAYGYGYDMRGVLIAELLQSRFSVELSAWARMNQAWKINKWTRSTPYSAMFYDTKHGKAGLQGERGYLSMFRIAREILGIDFVPTIHTDKSMTYIMQDAHVGIAA